MRTRGRTKPTIIGAIVAFMAIAVGATGVMAATAVDLTTAGIQRGPVEGAYFQQGPLPSSAGTGVLDPFLRVNATGNAPEIQRGYNTDYRPLQFDEDGSWTEALLLSTVPTVTGPGGLLYRALFLDINQTNKIPLLSLDELILYGGTSATYHGFNETTRNFTVPGAADVLWNLDGGSTDRYLKMDYSLEAGSGDSDVTMLVPETVFDKYTSCQYGQPGCTTWLYLWNRFGDNFANNDGFEEWSTQVLPYVQPAKTAVGTFDRKYEWTIDKTKDGEYSKFIGDPATKHDYNVDVKLKTTDSNIKVTGTITLTVPAKLPDGEKNSPDAVVQGITDVYEGTSGVVTCPNPVPFTIKAGSSVQCTYVVNLSSVVTGTNTVTVTIKDNPTPFKATAKVSAFSENSTGYKTINVTDDKAGALGSASADKSFPYSKDFACPTDLAKYTDGVYNETVVNTATISETGQKDSATVKLHCYAPLVSKTAAGTFDKEYTWKITKDFDATYNKLIGDPKTVHDYKVVVDQTITDSNFKVAGEITVKNPSPTLEMKVGLADKLSSGEAATIGACTDGTYSAGVLTIAAGKTAVCKYEAKPADATAGTNTATATLNALEFSGSKGYTFTANVIGKSTVNVTDDIYGALGSASADKTFNYTGDFACPTDVKMYTDGVYTKTVVNTATITETGAKDDATVKLNCYLPLVSKTAAGTFDKTYTWKITKDFDGEYWKFIGDPAVLHDYKVVVDQTVTPAKFLVAGEITVKNPSPTLEMKVGLVDKLSSGETATIGACTDGTYSAGVLTIAAGKTAVCKYEAAPASDAAGTNYATATLNAIDFKAEKAYTFTANVIGHPTVKVTDDTYPLDETVSGDAEFKYQGKFECPTDLSLYKDGVYKKTVVNTAKITETSQSDTATVTLNCYAPLVSKDAKTTYERKFDWKITKTAAKSELTLKIGQTYMLDYEVTVDKASTWYTDSKWAVSGTITIKNPNPKTSMTVDVSDKLTGDIVATVDCGAGSTSLTVAAGGTGTCTYKADLPNADTRTNTATATLNKLAFTGTAEVKFGDPTSLVDECINAYDNNATPLDKTDDVFLGKVCYTDTLPKTFKFTRQIGPYPVCGKFEVKNTAWIVTNDTATLKDSSWTVLIDVPCEGCTLTQGYWKTHSKYGPAPYDKDWALVGEDTQFFSNWENPPTNTNPVTWYEMFWITPKGGNPYVQLAHQWQAAYLNSIKSVDPAPFGDYQDEFDAAKALLAKYTYNTYNWKTDPDGVVAKFREYASLFASWNEGIIGPGHCDEDYLSSNSP